MDRFRVRLPVLLFAALIILAGHVNPAQAGTRSPVSVKATYLYDLATFTGNVPYSWPRIEPDSSGKEIYVINQNLVQIFDTNGMEVFRFGDSLDLGSITDLAVDSGGNILLLSHRWSDAKRRVDYEITRCNYRGEPVSKFELQNLPPKFSEFVPNRIVLQGAKLYFANLSTMTVVVTDVQGLFQGGYEILPLLELHEKDREGAMMDGFSVDRGGNILFSVPPIFRIYKYTPGGQITYFGKPGGAPGAFNIVAGVVSDAKGNILVVDRLKGSVLIFDREFNFIGQFSSVGYKPGFLIVPNDIVIDSQDRVYITQAARRGVSVFRLSYN
jgi:DNA-binding beta-propeller fold protein YncE